MPAAPLTRQLLLARSQVTAMSGREQRAQKYKKGGVGRANYLSEQRIMEESLLEYEAYEALNKQSQENQEESESQKCFFCQEDPVTVKGLKLMAMPFKDKGLTETCNHPLCVQCAGYWLFREDKRVEDVPGGPPWYNCPVCRGEFKYYLNMDTLNLVRKVKPPNYDAALAAEWGFASVAELRAQFASVAEEMFGSSSATAASTGPSAAATAASTRPRRVNPGGVWV